MLDVDALSTMIADIVSEEVGKAVTPLHAKIAELEARPAGSQMDDIKGVVEIMISDALVTKSVNQATVEQLIADEIAKIEPAKELDREELAALVNDAVAALPPPEVIHGEDGKSVEPEVLAQMVTQAVSKAVAALPVPKDGKDAAGIVAPVKDNGELCFTLQDGRLLRTGIRDGEKGADGKDGFSLDDYDEWFEDDGRTFVRRFVRGEDYKEFRHQTVLPRYLGVFKEGTEYRRGDTVTWGGSQWHCDKDTTAKPGTEDWTLSVKKGRDGKDFTPVTK